MLKCKECNCISETGRGWLGYITEDSEDEDGPIVAVYCPPCAERELSANPRRQPYI